MKEKTMMNKCYSCEHRGTVYYSCHSSCKNKKAKVKGHEQGIRGGWFSHPVDFDPVWLVECNGYEAKGE